MLRRVNTRSEDEKVQFEEKDFCQLCGSEFKALINRRHHCRTCGRSVCGK